MGLRAIHLIDPEICTPMPRQFFLSNSAIPAREKKSDKWRYILAGIMIITLPLAAILYQSYRIGNGILMRLPVQISRAQPVNFWDMSPKVRLTTSLNTIKTRSVAGQNNFMPNDKVFVFLSPGPNHIWYPYAISTRPPEQGCQVNECLALSGKIQSVRQDAIDIRYQYEYLAPSPELLQKLAYSHETDAEITLVVGKDGRSTVRALHIDGQTLNQRKIEISTLPGFTQNVESKAPVK